MNMVNDILTRTGWSQADLGFYTKTTQTTVWRWLNGQTPITGPASIVLQDLLDRLNRGEHIPKPSRQRDAPQTPLPTA